MGKLEQHRRGGPSAGGLVVALAMFFAISGCSSVPDYANPVEWYSSTVDFFDDDAPPPLPAEVVPGAQDPFPELSDTPEPPLREIELEYLDTIGEGLVADRANAQYTDTVIRAGGETALAETPTFQAETPTFQAVAPPLPTPPPALVAPLQPSTSVQIAQIESVTQQTVFQAQPMPLKAVGRGVDVQTMFANLFTSSGPRGVAPAVDGTQLTPAPSTSTVVPSSGLPSSASLILPGGARSLFSSNKAAVIYFALGSTGIDKEGRDALHKLAHYHKQNGGRLRVIGHASNRTKELSPERHELVNFDISFKRARAVADELIRHGVAPDRLEVVAMSDSTPAYQEWMPSGEAGNRRAEVFIDY